MNISERGIALIKKYEGFCESVYVCPAGKNTIGYGHVILADEEFGQIISEDEAEALLNQDINKVEQSVDGIVTVVLSQNEFDALVAFTYNIGAKAFANSTLLRLLNNNDKNGAALQFDRWVYASGRVLSGLVARRSAEKALFLS